MAVTGLVVADVAVLIGGSDFRMYEVPADRELQEMLIEGEAEFWRNVEQGTPPEPVSYSDMQVRFGRLTSGGTVEATPDVIDAVVRLQKVQEEIKRLEEVEQAEKAIVMKALGECDTLVSGGFTVATWKAAKPAQRFDSKGFQAAYPELYPQFLKAGEVSRRFLLK
jgi:predicted phage-related endonuclease